MRARSGSPFPSSDRTLFLNRTSLYRGKIVWAWARRMPSKVVSYSDSAATESNHSSLTSSLATASHPQAFPLHGIGRVEMACLVHQSLFLCARRKQCEDLCAFLTGS